jgi:hypothetical protein
MSGMKRLGLTGASLLALTALMAASGAVHAGASHPQSLCIDAEPDRNNPRSRDGFGDRLEISRGVSDGDHPPDSNCHTEQATGEPIEIDFEITGAADPDSGDSPERPDLTCVIEAEESSCRIRPPAPDGGPQEISAWVDVDVNNDTVELDRGEEQNESESPGDVAEPDNTDVVAWTWVQGHDELTTIRYHRLTGSFLGSIGTARKRCQRGRIVTVKRSRSGRDVLLKSDRTNRRGNWRVWGYPKIRGKFYAVARPKVFTDHVGDEVRCKRALSPTIRVRRRY